ncbi:hypothetical protein ABL78_4235 [Leptomonas seymouri]|uniref:RanBP2-type domain-containing protein n=1 Tax=Leptomonas seymouri TaxID=5684 RepID=A0A0N0P626_LEPSE|nr:hypothetical protein ABL78_4235 [Leptomonas seymouri]|eukprot:KPI86677.1 hypothetical protein ABL78_4235 [Leptomonas seymouri]
MYVRRPLAQRSSPRRRFGRWPASLPTHAIGIATASASTILSTSSSDFEHYVRSECSDVLFYRDCGLRTAALPGPTTANAQPPSAAISVHGSRLRCGPEVAAMPATHAVLNSLNSALWLPVLTCLQVRGALSSRDCASAIRHVPALTFRSLLPWLWAPTAAASGFLEARDTAQQLQGAQGRQEGSDEGKELGSLALVSVAAADVVDAALKVACRVPLAPTAAAATPAKAPLRTACSVADLGTADPQLWVAMLHSLVSGLPPAASYHDRLKLWHDMFFALRSHCTWNTTAAELREVGHPQLLKVFEAFYKDMRNHERESVGGEGLAAAVSADVDSRPLVAPPEVLTLTPPILLRKFRTLYRQHKHSAMLFAELYVYCVQQEEAGVQRWWLTLITAAAESKDSGSAGLSSTAAAVVRLRTTALLMDVDLAVYFASLPGRRYSGLATPAEQWAVTLEHVMFLLPRTYFLQRCLQAQRSGSSSTSAAELWKPWGRVASVLMNVCVWVDNDNREAVRCCAALRCAVEALQVLAAAPAMEDRLSLQLPTQCGIHTAVHTILGAPTAREISTCISTLVRAASDSMRVKAEQLHYGPTDGLFGVHLISVAVSAVLPAERQQPSLHDTQLKGSDKEVLEGGAEVKQGAAELLHQLRLFTHASKTSPIQLWSAQRRTPRAKDAARYGLVTVGYRLFRNCVVPLTLHTATLSSARRVFALLCAWADEVGRPLGLHGHQVSALWQLRWAQTLQHEGGEAATAHHPRSACASMMPELVASRRHSDQGGSLQNEWVCGCGFQNSCKEAISEGTSASCVACVLRDLVPHCWECSSCHTVSDSGVNVPYCLHCGEAHPSLQQQRSQQHRQEGEVKSSVRDLVYVCSACHTVSAMAPSIARESSASGAPLVSWRDDGGAHRCCDACGSHGTGYYTPTFTWSCGCGVVNSALDSHCHACSDAARRPTLTCPQCRHVQTSATAERCTRCEFPHPRRLATVQESRLVHCPACQGLAPSTSLSCPHCASTAISAVAALLPTVADQPWLCLRCGTTHPVRDAENGELHAPLALHLSEVAAGAPSPPPFPLRALHNSGADSRPSEGCCDHCGTYRIAGSTWERSRLWNCTACEARYNTGAACRRCAALAPGVPASAVHVWQCGICQAGNPSWETQCATAGCGGSAQRRDGPISDSRPSSDCCYSPWECAECGEVTLSSHVLCCTFCGASTPASVLDTACTGPLCVKSAAQSGTPSQTERALADHLIENNEDVVAVGAPPSACVALAELQGREQTPASRLAQVEAFLLRAAETETPLHAAALGVGLLCATPGGSLRPPAAESVAGPPAEGANVTVPAALSTDSPPCVHDGEEAWEDAYAAAVLSL